MKYQHNNGTGKYVGTLEDNI